MIHTHQDSTRHTRVTAHRTLRHYRMVHTSRHYRMVHTCHCATHIQTLHNDTHISLRTASQDTTEQHTHVTTAHREIRRTTLFSITTSRHYRIMIWHTKSDMPHTRTHTHTHTHTRRHCRKLFQSSKLKAPTPLCTETWQTRLSSFEL